MKVRWRVISSQKKTLSCWANFLQNDQSKAQHDEFMADTVVASQTFVTCQNRKSLVYKVARMNRYTTLDFLKHAAMLQRIVA